MKNVFNKLLLATGIVFSTIIFLGSCSKNDDDTSMGSSDNKNYFVNNVLARDLTVTLAKDNNTDITADFVSYTFRLNDSTGTYGSISAANIQKTIIGTWTADANFENLTFNFAATPVPALAFISKQWNITSRAGVTTTFAATNGEADMFQFTKK